MHSFLHFVHDLKEKKKEESELLVATIPSDLEQRWTIRNSHEESEEEQSSIIYRTSPEGG